MLGSLCKSILFRRGFQIATFFLFVFTSLCTVPGQSITGLDRDRARGMLDVIKGEIKRNYYDANFRGIDIEARFKAADEKIKSVESLSQAYGVIAQVLTEFEDSHLYFVPPPRPVRVEYGWLMQMIGDEGYVIAVKPGSDAEAKGLKPGDRLLKVDGFAPTRKNMWKMIYRYHLLRPQPGIQVEVQTGDEKPRELALKAKVIQLKRSLDYSDFQTLIVEGENADHLNRHRGLETSNVFIWKMPQFDLEDEQIDDWMAKARKSKALILDLRGNGGGYIKTLQRVVANLFNHDLTIADVKQRKQTKPLLAKTRGKDAFTGQLVVLIDSRSASAAELLARVVQLEKRGTVIGDRSTGAVMQSKSYPYEMGTDSIIIYGASITDADIIMSDGKSLEHTGVIPDELVILKGADLATGRDPVLSRAAALLGIDLSPEKAGALFPFEWPKL